MEAAIREMGLISDEALEVARESSARAGVELDEFLVHSGLISQEEHLALRAHISALPCADISGYEPDDSALQIIPETILRGAHIVPLAVDETTLYMAAPAPLNKETLALLRKHTQLPIKIILASRNSIDTLLQRLYEQEYTSTALNALLVSDPESSANRILSRGQQIFFSVLIIGILVALVLELVITLITLIAIASAFYLISSCYKFWLAYHSLGHEHFVETPSEELATLDEKVLPIYTILVPLYKEAAVVKHLIEHIEAMDYPKAKLDVKLLCEEDDTETISAIRKMHLPPHYRLTIVPESQPKTKPKACNFGLLQATGKYVVIYDAEDRPEADQLKKAILAFMKSPADVACVQARLNYYNQIQNVLTKWFSVEYSMHFDLLLPGLCAKKIPVPLGGTSNHFERDTLVALGAWDPHNVTEDADLGIRLHKDGYMTTMIDSTTLEEANSEIHNWVRQRSRWVKGYIQTWLVHMRHPFQLIHQLGWKGFFAFNFVVGGTFITFLLNPIFWTLTTVFLLTQAHAIQILFPSLLFYVAATLLFVGNFIFIYFNVAGSMQRGYFHLTRYALLSPIYWGLMSWAAWKGFIQLFTNPFYWEKTVHGLDQGFVA